MLLNKNNHKRINIFISCFLGNHFDGRCSIGSIWLLFALWACRKEVVVVALDFEVTKLMMSAVKSTHRVWKSPFAGTVKGDIFTVTNEVRKLECTVEFTHLWSPPRWIPQHFVIWPNRRHIYQISRGRKDKRESKYFWILHQGSGRPQTAIGGWWYLN